MKTLFVTGATGFIGTHLLQRLVSQNFEKIYCLSRNPKDDISDIQAFENVEFIQGDIFDGHLYSRHLATSDVVLHLAAITGKAKPDEYFRVNAAGTEFLIKQCENQKVKNFFYVSSIATKFTDISQYYYALSKKQGENALRKSAVNYVIVRPTIVLGHESPIWHNLLKLVKGPFSIIFGDGKTNIQPILIDDLVKCFIAIIKEDNFQNEEFDLGGPEIVTFEHLLKRIHTKYYGKDSRVIHIPLKLLIPLLTILEKKLYSLLPINVGQLSSFRDDSTIQGNRIFNLHQDRMTTLEQMLKILVGRKKEEISVNELANECRVFCNYLVDQAPNDYVIEKYLEAHKREQLDRKFKDSLFDRMLLYIAKMNQICTKLVDVYTRLFYQHSLFRRKLVLLLAILESCSPYFSFFDRVDSPSRLVTFLKLIQKTLAFAVISVPSVLLLGPLHVTVNVLTRLRGRA